MAERAIRTLTETAAAMLIDSGLPHLLWEDALHHAAFIRNRVQKRQATITPHERLFGSKPFLGSLPIFGQSLVVRTPDPIRRKSVRFDGRGNIGAFVGFSEQVRGFRVYIPGDRRPIKETTDVVELDSMLRDEVVLPDDQEPPAAGGGDEAAELLRDLTGLSDREVEAINGITDMTRRRRSERIQARSINAAFLAVGEIIREPLNLVEARRSAQWDKWQEAIQVELRALEANETFDLVDPPSVAHVLDNTVQFRLKTGPDGEITQYKARVCARGDRQIYMVDYVDTRAPVADLVCVRLFFVIVSKYHMVMRQGDVPAAYLKADVNETIYVRQVKGFEAPGQEHKVWKLKKALYGLKQAGREWNKEIDAFLRNHDR